jgi:trigger factor
MAVKWEKTEPNTGVLEVEVTAEQFSDALDQAFKKVVKTVAMPGFRKGKVPRKIFESRYGVESLYQDALDLVVPNAYSTAVFEAQLVPVDRPKIDVVQVEAGKPLLFKATVTLKPEVTLGDYINIPFEDKTFEVTDEMLDEELQKLRSGHSELNVLEDGEAEAGDLLVMDFNGFVAGEEFEGGEAENYQLELGSGTFVPGFEDQLIGVKAGEDREVKITFPGEYHVKSLAGQEAMFQIHVHDIKRKTLPVLDDDFAKDISEFDTIEELKADVRHQLEHEAEHQHEHYIEDQIIAKVVENAIVDIPAVMIEDEIDVQINEFGSRLEQQGIPLDAYQEFTGTTKDELRDQFRQEAERRVKSSLVLEAIAIKENISLVEQEIDLELQKVADATQLEFDRVKEIIGSRDPGFAGIKSDIVSRKTIQLLVERSTEA